MASPIGGTGTLTGPIVRAQAKLRYSTVTPMKARRVVDLVRGLPADEALATLRFAAQSASEPVYKVLESAIANAQHQAQLRNERLDVEDLVVSAAYVDEGPTMKRFRPRAQGRAYRIRKRTSHITIHVESWSADAETQATKRSVPKRVRAVARPVPTARPAALAPAAPAKEAAAKDAAKTTAKKATASKESAAPAGEVTDKPAKKTAAKKTAEPKATVETGAEKPAKKTTAAPAKKTAAKKADAAASAADPEIENSTSDETEGGTR